MDKLKHPEQYGREVLNGNVVVCRWVRLAVERHFNDLETAHERGLYFDEQAAWHFLIFCHLCHHYKGEWAGKVFSPEPWQVFFFWVLFGWRRADGSRRFRICYLEIARKNGKTFMGAVVGLYLTYADGEPAAEVYSCATKKDQAKICHKDATRIVKNSVPLRGVFDVFKDSLSVDASASVFQPLGRDADSMDGLNVHGAIKDELHAWKTRDLWDIIDTATGSRVQPLTFVITTSGFNRNTVCYEQHQYLKKILEGHVVDDDYFGMIFTLDAAAELDDEKEWVKANPNLGVSVKLEYLRKKVDRARELPAAYNAVIRLHFNMWTQAETRWMDPDKWRACKSPFTEESLHGRACYGGLDLSSTTDISALVLVFPPVEDGEPYKALCRFWIPEEAMTERSKRDRVPYDAFVRAGQLMTTPGQVIDYDFITHQVEQDCKAFDLREVAFDRWGATKVRQELEKILPPYLEDGKERDRVIQFGQGFASMSSPMKELESMVIAVTISHGGNKVLAWMADNVVAKEDPAGNVKPDKSRSIEKIDGIVALVMALDRALHGGAGNVGSVYDKRGLRAL